MSSEWIDGYLAAWNSHDGRQVAAFMAEDVVYDDLASGLVHRGRDAVQAYVEQTVAFSDDYRFVTVSTQADRNDYAIEWEISVPTPARQAGSRPPGSPIASVAHRSARSVRTARSPRIATTGSSPPT
ncbi:MAG: nuclear transport factor 2 family protein [Acidimicrobiales bacterium]|nr:nuclear transport factor 2 family protein [Acidimicrobiales bacterium]